MHTCTESKGSLQTTLKKANQKPFNIILKKNDDQMRACNFTADVILSCLNLLSIFCGAFYGETKM